MAKHIVIEIMCDNKCLSDNDNESCNHDETTPFTCDDHDGDESDKSLAVKRCYIGGDESGIMTNTGLLRKSDLSLATNARFLFRRLKFSVPTPW